MLPENVNIKLTGLLASQGPTLIVAYIQAHETMLCMAHLLCKRCTLPALPLCTCVFSHDTFVCVCACVRVACWGLHVCALGITAAKPKLNFTNAYFVLLNCLDIHIKLASALTANTAVALSFYFCLFFYSYFEYVHVCIFFFTQTLCKQLLLEIQLFFD